MPTTRIEYTIEVTSAGEGPVTLVPIYGGRLSPTQERLHDLRSGASSEQTYNLVQRTVTTSEWEPADTTVTDLIAVVRKFAAENYERGGDTIVEAFTDEEITEEILQGLSNEEQALSAVRTYIGLHEEQVANVLSQSGEHSEVAQSHMNNARKMMHSQPATIVYAGRPGEPAARLQDGRTMPMGWNIGQTIPIGTAGTAEYITSAGAGLWQFTPEVTS